MSTPQIEQVLSQIRSWQRSNESGGDQRISTGGSDFARLFAASLQQVNGLQNEASTLKTSWETGAADIDLPQVMIASQKASLAFEATAEIRNKVLNAYQEIMNMQV